MMPDELRDDEIRAAERDRRRAQHCLDCRHAWWVQQFSGDFNDCVTTDPANLGVCVIEGDPLSVMGITIDDTALSTDCDMFEAVER